MCTNSDYNQKPEASRKSIGKKDQKDFFWINKCAIVFRNFPFSRMSFSLVYLHMTFLHTSQAKSERREKILRKLKSDSKVLDSGRDRKHGISESVVSNLFSQKNVLSKLFAETMITCWKKIELENFKVNKTLKMLKFFRNSKEATRDN